MLSSHYTQALLRIKDAKILKIENRSNEPILDIWIELKRDIHECPRCKELTEAIHDYRIHKVKGPPLGDRFILYHYRKRRYVCTECGKRFDELNSFVPRYHRREEQKKFSKERRRYFKRSKKLLWARYRKLNQDNQQAVEVMLALSHRLRTAYLLKEKFLEFVDAPTLDEAKKKLHAWYLYVNSSQLPEFDTCFETISRWQDSILNSFKVSYSNGYTESVNNKIKVLKRNAFGVGNFKKFRARILYMMSA